MSMNVHQKGKHYYAVFYDRDRRPSKKWVPLGTTTKRAAIQRAAALERDFVFGVYDPWTSKAPEAGVTLAEATRRFLASREGKSPQTLRHYRSILERFARGLALGIVLDHVKPADVDAFVRQAGLADASRASYFRHLRTFFNWAASEKLAPGNPIDRVEAPKAGRKEARYLSALEVDRVVKAARALAGGEDPDHCWLADVIEFAVGTGLRLGEIVALRRADVDLEHGFVTVRRRAGARTKSGHERRVPLVEGALEVARRRLALPDGAAAGGAKDGERALFTNSRGGPLNGSYTSKRFKAAVRAADLSEEFHFHSLRHSAASWMVVQGVPIPVVQAVLGHADIGVTMRYSHLAPDAMRDHMSRAFGRVQRGVGEPAPFYKCSTNPVHPVHSGAFLSAAA